MGCYDICILSGIIFEALLHNNWSNTYQSLCRCNHCLCTDSSIISFVRRNLAKTRISCVVSIQKACNQTNQLLRVFLYHTPRARTQTRSHTSTHLRTHSLRHAFKKALYNAALLTTAIVHIDCFCVRGYFMQNLTFVCSASLETTYCSSSAYQTKFQILESSLSFMWKFFKKCAH